MNHKRLTRTPHKQVHPTCPHGATSWTACDKSAQEALGRCRSLTKGEDECSNWALDDAGYCGQHLAFALAKEDRDRRAIFTAVERNERIDRYLAWREGHPSVWDRMPRVNDVVRSASPDPDAGPEPPTVGPHPPVRASVLWRASSGEPAPG